MHALFQRLRELDWDTFQRLAQQLLAARHPTLEIKHVEGAGGDKGLDLFNGTLAAGPNIWQCKHFPNGLKARQRPQVVKSLKAAVTNFHPQNWILVISIDLDTPGHEWFQGLAERLRLEVTDWSISGFGHRPGANLQAQHSGCIFFRSRFRHDCRSSVHRGTGSDGSHGARCLNDLRAR
jgi:hypothetical protein